MIKKGQKVYFWVAGNNKIALTYGYIKDKSIHSPGHFLVHRIIDNVYPWDTILLHSSDCFRSKQEAIAYKVHTQTYEIAKAMDTLAGAKLAIETCFQLLSKKEY